MKYIVFNEKDFIIIPDYMNHIDVVKDITQVKSAGTVRFYGAKSQAGEYVIVADCYGKSISLGIESKPEEDSDLISIALYI